MEDWLQLVLSNRYISGCLWQNHMAIESNSEKRDSVQTNKMNKDPYHYPCESSLETLAQHLPVLISASPIFTEPPASQKLKLVFTNKKYDKKLLWRFKSPNTCLLHHWCIFFIIAEFWSLSACYRLKLDRIYTQKKAYKK